MCFVVIDVFDNLIDLRLSDRKGAITVLPIENAEPELSRFMSPINSLIEIVFPN